MVLLQVTLPATYSVVSGFGKHKKKDGRAVWMLFNKSGIRLMAVPEGSDPAMDVFLARPDISK
jgi:hypothetical protein